MSLAPLNWDERVYQLWHATHPSSAMLAVASILTEAPLVLAFMIAFWQFPKRGAVLVHVLCMVFLCLAIEQTLGWLHPIARPFAAGWGPAWVAHAANNSYPSTHVALAAVLGFALLQQARRAAGYTCLGLAAVLGWARVYAGLHWPSDVLGAIGLAALSFLMVEIGFASRHSKKKHSRFHLDE